MGVQEKESNCHITCISMHPVILHISYERVKHNSRGGSHGRHTCILCISSFIVRERKTQECMNGQIEDVRRGELDGRSMHLNQIGISSINGKGKHNFI